MPEIKYIIVQAGGKGTRMEHLTHNKPKALTPIGAKPMIFHLFDKYPSKKFVVIGDYMYDVLERYLKTFATVDYEMVNAEGKKGTCGGLTLAFEHIPKGEPFLLIWCDLVLPEQFELPKNSGNYVGISKDFPCRWSWKNGKFIEERSFAHGVAGLFLFEEKSLLEDVPEEGEFVHWLSEVDIPFQELPLCQTKEYGLLEEWEKLPVQRCRPFNRIEIEGERLHKEGMGEQGKKLAMRESAWYQKVGDKDFANIPKIYSYKPLIMEYIKGKNIYECTALSQEEKGKALSEIIDCLRLVHALEQVPAEHDSYLEAYIGKTFERLKKVWDLVPFGRERMVPVNGRACRNVLYRREELTAAMQRYFPSHFELLHGDCTFSNIMLRGNGSPVLIDPRGYFGFTELYGDPAYDWAKLYYSIVGNYDQFNLKRFSLEIRDTEIELNIASNGWENMEERFFALLGGEVQREQIQLIHAIIWLSLTTYAWQDYDSICGAFYNGLYYLEEAL